MVFIERVQAAGFDGIELSLPLDPAARDDWTRRIADAGLALIVGQWETALVPEFDAHRAALAELPMTVPQEKLSGQIVLVGYGRVGRRIAAALMERGIHFVVAEENREIVDQLRKQGIPAVAGNAGEPAVLIQAHITHATMLVIATPDTFHVRAILVANV